MNLDALFKDIIELEKENYQKMYNESEKIYDESFMFNELQLKHFNGQGIIAHYKDTILLSFVRFIIVKNTLRLASLQIREGCEYDLRALIKDTYNQFKNLDFEIIESDIYKKNHSALIFNMKLRFEYYKTVGNNIRLRTSKRRFMESLEKYIK